MRRLGALLALLAVCFAAGCGGDHGDNPVSPLDDALGYFSKDAPFVAAIDSNPDGAQVKQLEELAGRFPGSDILGARLRDLTRFRAARWDRDVRPQLGAPLVVGLARPAAGSGIPVVLIAAMRVKHPLRAKQSLLREPGFRGDGKSSGVRIYEDTGDHRYAAVDGDTVVLATNRDILEQALSLKRTHNRMREGDFDNDVSKLPQNGLARISADPRSLIGADARLRRAVESVKWLAALRRMGAVIRATPSGVTLDFHAATDARSLTDDDLPLAPSTRTLPLIGKRGEVQVAIAEPSRLARFLFEVAHAIAPIRMKALGAAQPKGVELERQVPHHLNKLLDVSVNPLNRDFALRADLNEPSDVRDALTQLAPALPSLATLFGMPGLGLATPEAGESFYALAKPNGRTVVFGVLGDSLVAASEARRAADLLSESTHFAPGNPKAAAVVTLNAREVAGKVLAKALGGPAALFAPLAVASLRDLTGVATISRKGLDGHARLTIVK